MRKQFILVVYDISNDKRRAKLHNVLLDYGTPVQYSVFECLLDAKNLSKLKKAVAHAIRPRKDHVRYYYLCADCAAKTETTRNEEVHSAEPKTLVI
jgi:CRISPR-associated protein Cas2